MGLVVSSLLQHSSTTVENDAAGSVSDEEARAIDSSTRFPGIGKRKRYRRASYTVQRPCSRRLHSVKSCFRWVLIEPRLVGANSGLKYGQVEVLTATPIDFQIIGQRGQSVLREYAVKLKPVCHTEPSS